ARQLDAALALGEQRALAVCLATDAVANADRDLPGALGRGARAARDVARLAQRDPAAAVLAARRRLDQRCARLRDEAREGPADVAPGLGAQRGEEILGPRVSVLVLAHVAPDAALEDLGRDPALHH